MNAADATARRRRAAWKFRVRRTMRGADMRVLLTLENIHWLAPRFGIAVCSLAAAAGVSDGAARRAIRRGRDAGLIATEPMQVDMGGYYRMVNHFTFLEPPA